MLKYLDSQLCITKLCGHIKMSATTGTDLLKSHLDRFQANMQSKLACLDATIDYAKRRVVSDHRWESIKAAGDSSMILPEYSVAAALLANSHDDGLAGLPAGTFEEHDEALRLSYTLLCFLMTAQPELVLRLGGTAEPEQAGAESEAERVDDPVTGTVVDPAGPADRDCDQCGKTFTNTRIRDNHITRVHGLPLTPVTYDRSNPVCWGKSRCGYSACKIQKAAGHTSDGCGKALHPAAPAKYHKILVDKWGAASQPTGDGIATEHEAMVHIVTCAMHADTANKRHLSNHGQHRDLEPRPNPRDEFGGLRAQQAAHVLSQVNRLLQLEKQRNATDTFLVGALTSVVDSFYDGIMDSVVPEAIKFWNQDSHSGRKRRRNPLE